MCAVVCEECHIIGKGWVSVIWPSTRRSRRIHSDKVFWGRPRSPLGLSFWTVFSPSSEPMGAEYLLQILELYPLQEILRADLVLDGDIARLVDHTQSLRCRRCKSAEVGAQVGSEFASVTWGYQKDGTTSSFSLPNVTSAIGLPAIGLASPVHGLHLKPGSGYRLPEIPFHFLWTLQEQPAQKIEFVPTPEKHMLQGSL